MSEGMNADILNAPIIPSDFVACSAHTNRSTELSMQTDFCLCLMSYSSADNQTAWSSLQINQLYTILSNQFQPQAPIALWTNCNIRFARTNESVSSFLGQHCAVQKKKQMILAIFHRILHICKQQHSGTKKVLKNWCTDCSTSNSKCGGSGSCSFITLSLWVFIFCTVQVLTQLRITTILHRHWPTCVVAVVNREVPSLSPILTKSNSGYSTSSTCRVRYNALP